MIGIDPVCGVEVEVEGAPALEVEGELFVFCGERCRRSFTEELERLAGAEREVMEAGEWSPESAGLTLLPRARSMFALGILCFGAGLVVGVLWAPAAGARTRRRLRRKGKQLADRAARVKDSAAEFLDRARR